MFVVFLGVSGLAFVGCFVLWLLLPQYDGLWTKRIVLVFSLYVTLCFRIYVLTSPRSEVLVGALGSDFKQSQINAVGAMGDR